MSHRSSFLRALFRTKPLDRLVSEAEQPDQRLRRALGPVQLTCLGIGAIVGAGIFSTVGTAAAGGAHHDGAGPALIVSFVLVAMACGLAALCYAEFAALVPVAGSAYTYAYATLGELVAWMIGWDLIIEYAIGNVAVAISWSAYFQQLLRGFGWDLPPWLGVDYRTALQAAAQVATAGVAGEGLSQSVLTAAKAMETAPHLLGMPIVFNLPAVAVVLLITWVLVVGVRESAWWNTVMVLIKLVIICVFLAIGAFHIKPENWSPFAPNGFGGISHAAAIIFFAYIGFDAITTAAEETRDPQRNLPVGIIASLVVCTVLYIAVAVVLTGMTKWDRLGTADPLAEAFASRGMNWVAGIVSFGAVVATASVLLVFQLGQPRIFFVMARDGLLPAWAAKVHPKYRTPHVTTIWTGVAVAMFAGVANIDEVVELTNIGTLFAFALVAAGVMVLRRTDPDRPRTFRTPWVPLVPMLAAGACLYLMIELPGVTWARFGVWMLAGLAIYFGYSRQRSRLNTTA